MIRKVSGRSPSIGKSVATGVMAGGVWTLLSAMVIAKLVDTEVLTMENIGYGSMAAVLTAVFAAASIAGKRAGHLMIQASVISGVTYFICLLLANALLFGGSYTGMGITLFMTVLATGLAILTAGKGGGKRGRRRYKIPKP